MLVLRWIETDRKREVWKEGGREGSSTEQKKKGSTRHCQGGSWGRKYEKKALNGMSHLFACYLRGGTLYDGGYKDVGRLRQLPWRISIKKGKKVPTCSDFFVSSRTSSLALNPKDYSSDFHLTGLCSSISGAQSPVIES